MDSFNLATMEWTREPDFPFLPFGATTNLPYGRSFLSIGGHANNANVDHIYRVLLLLSYPLNTYALIYINVLFQYDPDNNDWDMLPVTLKKPLYETAAFILDEDNIQC